MTTITNPISGYFAAIAENQVGARRLIGQYATAKAALANARAHETPSTKAFVIISEDIPLFLEQ